MLRLPWLALSLALATGCRKAPEPTPEQQKLPPATEPRTEVAPPFDPSGNTALVGATMMFEILCVLAEAVARRKNR